MSPTVEEMRKQLSELGLDSRGTAKVLKKKLRTAKKSLSLTDDDHAQDQVEGELDTGTVVVNDDAKENGGGENVDGETKSNSNSNPKLNGNTDDQQQQTQIRNQKQKQQSTPSATTTIKKQPEPKEPEPVEEDLDLTEEERIQLNWQPYDYYCVFDVEATCIPRSISAKSKDYPNEIIEFTVILINGRTQKIISEFQSYVKPNINPILSTYCTELTGIQQSQVENAPKFPTVLKSFIAWLESQTGLKQNQFQHKVKFITDGPWDLRDFVTKQCIFSGISKPNFMKSFVDLRKLFVWFYGKGRTNLAGMLGELEMVFEGREHCGMDDTRNITRIVLRMMEDGCRFRSSYHDGGGGGGGVIGVTAGAGGSTSAGGAVGSSSSVA
ncbi:3'-5' exoribonuclease 1 [Blyttiomyces sp. JEL0837]|nr:3'-5' exoribonuclease 1 [Blyttiomyces sp. JEL0837]